MSGNVTLPGVKLRSGPSALIPMVFVDERFLCQRQSYKRRPVHDCGLGSCLTPLQQSRFQYQNISGVRMVGDRYEMTKRE